MSERMSEERWEELRKFDVGDPATWPAVEIDYGELLAEINALRAELTKAERGRNEIHADFTELESEGLRLQGLWLADIAKAERERDSARADALEEAAKVADDRVEPMRLLGVKNKESSPIDSERCHARAIEANHIAAMIRYRKSFALTPTQESETP